MLCRRASGDHTRQCGTPGPQVIVVASQRAVITPTKTRSDGRLIEAKAGAREVGDVVADPGRDPGQTSGQSVPHGGEFVADLGRNAWFNRTQDQIQIAGAAGLDENIVSDMLPGDRFAADIFEDGRQAAIKAVTGVPKLVIDDRSAQSLPPAQGNSWIC